MKVMRKLCYPKIIFRLSLKYKIKREIFSNMGKFKEESIQELFLESIEIKLIGIQNRQLRNEEAI